MMFQLVLLCLIALTSASDGKKKPPATVVVKTVPSVVQKPPSSGGLPPPVPLEAIQPKLVPPPVPLEALQRCELQEMPPTCPCKNTNECGSGPPPVPLEALRGRGRGGPPPPPRPVPPPVPRQALLPMCPTLPEFVTEEECRCGSCSCVHRAANRKTWCTGAGQCQSQFKPMGGDKITVRLPKGDGTWPVLGHLEPPIALKAVQFFEENDNTKPRPADLSRFRAEMLEERERCGLEEGECRDHKHCATGDWCMNDPDYHTMVAGSEDHPKYKCTAFRGALRAALQDTITGVNHFYLPDTEFNEIWEATPEEKRASEITIAVADTGVIDTLSPVAGKVTSHLDATGFTVTNDNKKDFDWYDAATNIVDSHGTSVACNAAWGTPKIKIIDVKVQTSTTQNAEALVTEQAQVIQEAIDAGAKVVTTSVSIKWNAAKLQEVIDNNPNVIFFITSGNDKKTFTNRPSENDIEGFLPKRANNVFVAAGVTNTMRKHKNRGSGAAIDITAPSGKADDDKKRGMPVCKPWESVKHTQEHPERVNAEAKARFSGDEAGISFGLPILANTAAKAMLIDKDLSAAELRAIFLGQGVAYKGILKNQLGTVSASGGVIDPVGVYTAAKAKAESRGMNAFVSAHVSVEAMDVDRLAGIRFPMMVAFGIAVLFTCVSASYTYCRKVKKSDNQYDALLDEEC